MHAVCDELCGASATASCKRKPSRKAPKKLSVAEETLRAQGGSVGAETATLKEAQNNKKLTAKERKPPLRRRLRPDR